MVVGGGREMSLGITLRMRFIRTLVAPVTFFMHDFYDFYDDFYDFYDDFYDDDDDSSSTHSVELRNSTEKIKQMQEPPLVHSRY